MRDTADMAWMCEVRSRQAFFDCDIVYQNQPLAMELESTPDFPHSETCAARGPFFGMRFWRILSLAFLTSSSVAAFRGLNSDSRNGVCFATSCHAHEIIAPEGLYSYAVSLSVRPNSSSEGERCMKHTVHRVVHFSVHRRIFGKVRSRRSCA